MQPRSGGDVSNHNYCKPDPSSMTSSTSFLPTPLEHSHPTDSGTTPLYTHQAYTREDIFECGLRPDHGNAFAGNISQYNTVTHLPEQPVGRAQQSFPTLTYTHHHPVNPQLSPYQGHTQYLPGPYETDSSTTLPPQLTTSSPSVFYDRVDQIQETSTTAEVSASRCHTPPQALGSPSSPVLSMNQALGFTPYRQADNGPRRILAVPVQSLPITDPTIYAVVASFQIAPWMRHQVEEPAPAGKSCYFQLIDEPTMACRLCGKYERRVERLVSHLRGHFDHRPYPCKGQCGIMDCGQRFTERRGVKDHVERPSVQCPKCIPVKMFSKQNLPRHLRDQHQT